MLISIQNADVSYGGDPILEDVHFDIRKEEKIAVVGRNGCGKTTLLKLITGELTPQPRDSDDLPSVVRTGDPTIGWLSQMTFANEEASLGDELRSVFAPVLELKARMDTLLEKLSAGGDEKLAEEYAALEERFSYLGGYRYEKDYEQLFSRFGFSKEDEDRALSSFSGGQRTKIAFIKLLLTRPDILLLDEPTNHLDISTIAWLEGYIAEYPRAVVVVSHDRLFLDRVAETVYEIERGHVTRYFGNYSDYVRQKKERYEHQKKEYLAQQKEKERLQTIADHFIGKPTKAAMARSKRKAIERMEVVEKPEEEDLRAFHGLSEPLRQSGRDVLIVENLGIGYEESLCRVNLNLQKGKKLGIIGGNGLGKSTFLRTIMGKIPKKSGKYSFGYAVDVAYFEQQMARSQSTKTVLDEFWDEYPSMTETEVRSVLGGFLFSGDDVYKNVSEISGGERVRLALAKLLQTRPNLLLLDEPTNHMDIVGKEALEEMLSSYTGTLVFVSHDRYLIRRLADELLIFKPGEAEYFPFGYEEYERHYGKEKILEASAVWKIDGHEKEEETAAAAPPVKKGNPGKERARAERRQKRLEELLQENDGKKAGLEAELADPRWASDYEKLQEIQQKLDEAAAQEEAWLAEWEKLEEELSET